MLCNDCIDYVDACYYGLTCLLAEAVLGAYAPILCCHVMMLMSATGVYEVSAADFVRDVDESVGAVEVACVSGTFVIGGSVMYSYHDYASRYFESFEALCRVSWEVAEVRCIDCDWSTVLSTGDSFEDSSVSVGCSNLSDGATRLGCESVAY